MPPSSAGIFTQHVFFCSHAEIFRQFFLPLPRMAIFVQVFMLGLVRYRGQWTILLHCQPRVFWPAVNTLSWVLWSYILIYITLRDSEIQHAELISVQDDSHLIITITDNKNCVCNSWCEANARFPSSKKYQYRKGRRTWWDYYEYQRSTDKGHLIRHLLYTCTYKIALIK